MMPRYICFLTGFICFLSLLYCISSSCADRGLIDPPARTANEKANLTNEKFFELAIKRLDNTITVYGFFMTFIVSAFSIGIAITGNSAAKNQREFITREIETIRNIENRFSIMDDKVTESINSGKDSLENHFQTLKQTVTNEIASSLDNIKNYKVPEFTEAKVEELFETKYTSYIAYYSRAVAEEYLMLAPEARGHLVSLLRRMNFRDLPPIIELSGTTTAEDIVGAIDRGLADQQNRYHEIINMAIDDWHCLCQLYSNHEDQLEIGVGYCITLQRSFPEALVRLRTLHDRHRMDLTLYPMIRAAIGNLEKQQQSPAYG